MSDQNYSAPNLVEDTDHELLFKAAYALWLTEQGGGGGSLPDQTGHAGEFLTTNGTDASWAALAGGGDVVASGALTSNTLIIGQGGSTIASTTTGSGILTFLGTPSSANLAAAVTGETGTGALVFGTGPTLGSPVIAKIANLNTNGYLKTESGDGTLAETSSIPWADIASVPTNVSVLGGLADPNADRIVFWDDSAGAIAYLTVGSGLTITDDTITASGSGTPAGADTQIQFNNAGSFGASAALSWGSGTLNVGTAGTAGSIDLASDGAAADPHIQLANVAGGFAQLSPASGISSGTVTIPLVTGIMVVDSATQTLTNKTINGSSNTITNVAISTAVSGLGTGVATALAVNTGSAGAVVLFNGALGTPSSGTLTSCTGLPVSSGISGLGTGVATFLATPSSANLASAVTDETGSGALVFATTPTLVTPILGTPTSGTLTNCTIPASGITAGTLAANVTLGEGAGNLLLDATLSADGTYSGILQSGTAGATLAFGDLCYFSVTDSRWELADASAASTSGSVMLGICVLAAAADADPTTMLLFGKVRADTAFPTFTVGAPVYASETAGDVTETQPTTTDAVIRVLGFAQDGNSIWFMPSGDYLTHV